MPIMRCEYCENNGYTCERSHAGSQARVMRSEKGPQELRGPFESCDTRNRILAGVEQIRKNFGLVS